MSIANHARQIRGNRNASLIAGLREVAEFLEANPGLPPFNGYVMRHSYGKEARAELTAVAEALGDAADETATPSEVRITGAFPRVKLGAFTTPEKLGATPAPRPVDYDPIVKREVLA